MESRFKDVLYDGLFDYVANRIKERRRNGLQENLIGSRQIGVIVDDIMENQELWYIIEDAINRNC